MIIHIVMWKLKEEAEGKTKLQNSEKIKKDLEALKEKIKEIVKIEVGINVNSSEAAYDLVLNSEFKNEEDLDKYQNNPLHLEVAKYINKVKEDRIVADYIK